MSVSAWFASARVAWVKPYGSLDVKTRGGTAVQVIVSLAAVAAFGLALIPLGMHIGVWGLVKYWLMPLLGYHFWMSTFTVVHHTAPHIPFKKAEDWSAVGAQLGGTVHCDYPFW